METRTQRWQRKNPEKRRLAVSNYTRRMRATALATLGGKCTKCGFEDYRALQIDHINGGGTKAMGKLNGASHWKLVITSFLAGKVEFQLLCANCNWIKRWENKETPGRPRQT